MFSGVDGLRVRIAMALGLGPLLLAGPAGCAVRSLDDPKPGDDAGEGSTGSDPTDSGSGSASGSGEGSASITVGTGSSASGSDGGTGPVEACWPTDAWTEWEFWTPTRPTGECLCDELCQETALQQWYEDHCCDSCWYVFGEVLCVEHLGDTCHFLVSMREDGCGEGRPLLIDGRARTAEACEGVDWAEPDLAPWVDALSPAQRRMLAERWTRAALAEHASVASFARFVLDLSALGAPPALLLEATTAMQDEVRHARVAFGLASAYAGYPVGPGPLPMHGLVAGGDAEAIVRAAVREGCIEETLAAAEAELAAHRATDPTVRAVLSAIADDEASHAVLAWRFVDWAVQRDPSLAAVVREELQRAFELADAASDRADERHTTLDAAALRDQEVASAHGMLPPTLRQLLRARCLRGTIMPCATAMLQGCWDSDSAQPSS